VLNEFRGLNMASSTLIRRGTKEEFSASKVRVFIAEYLGVEVDCIKADSHLTDDFGLDLLDIVELMILLEKQFVADGKVTDETDEIEFVSDLIRHIEDSHPAV
jgi:acyl carrier protein